MPRILKSQMIEKLAQRGYDTRHNLKKQKVKDLRPAFDIIDNSRASLLTEAKKRLITGITRKNRLQLVKEIVKKAPQPEVAKLVSKTRSQLVTAAKARNVKTTTRLTKPQIAKELKKANDQVAKAVDLLKSGDLKSVNTLVNRKYKFKTDDIRALNNFITKELKKGHKYEFRLTLADGTDQRIPITMNSLPAVKQMLKDTYFEAIQTQTGSDLVDEILNVGIVSGRIVKLVIPTNAGRNQSGNFFNYINKTDIDLTRYQIMREEDLGHPCVNEQCLIHALMEYGVDLPQINAIKLAFKTGDHIAKNKLNQVSDIIQKNIKLHFYAAKNNKTQQIRTQEFNTKYEDTVHIALHSEHYFLFEETEFTSYSIKNYRQVKDIENFHNISRKRTSGRQKGQYHKDNKEERCNSLFLVDTLMKTGFFDNQSASLIKLDEYRGKYRDELDIPLDDIENEQRLIKLAKEPEHKKEYTYFFADTESFVRTNPHVGFMTGISCLDHDNDINPPIIFTRIVNDEQAWFTDLLKYIKKYTKKGSTPVVYYHNLKYDFSLFKKLLIIHSICEKDGQIYEVEANFPGSKLTIKFRDSYKLMSAPLSKFADIFSLPKGLKKKEAIGYSYYTPENFLEDSADIDEYLEHVKESERDQFLKNITTLNTDDPDDHHYPFGYDKDSNTFDHMAYYEYYLMYDVLVLKEGLKVFREKLRAITNLDAFEILTISSLTHNFMLKNGAYKDIYEVCGNLREFISKAIYGGRVAVLESDKKQVITKQLLDVDAVSLYPSSIARLCREIGIPKGITKRLDKQDLKTLDYYVVKINITKINKQQQIPFIAHRHTTDGVPKLDYVNEVPEEGLTTIVDKITLEDYIKFHEIEYTVLDGVYWNNGFTKTMGTLIENLFENRLKEKALLKKFKTSDPAKAGGHDCMQGMIKLMLNSAYGKTIMKKSNISKTIVYRTSKKSQVKDDNIDKYIYKHFHTITNVTYLNEHQAEVTKLTSDTSYNISHAGCVILSYSKRIMNEVMGLANDNNIKVYYQDTDSMHIERSQYKGLIEKYESTYNRILDGKNMGQFHSDFELKGAAEEVYSTKSIFLGKKCYLDCLESKNDKGETITGHHVRMKGVTVEGIEHCKDTVFNGSYVEMYDHLRTKPQKFILNPGEKKLFEYYSGGVRFKEGDFIREVKF